MHVSDVLLQRTAVKHIEKLAAPAQSKHRFPRIRKLLKHRHLQFIFGLVDAVGMCIFFAIPGRIHISASRQHKAVEARHVKIIHAADVFHPAGRI